MARLKHFALAAAMAGLAALLSAGCQPASREDSSRRQLVEAYGQLPGLKETPDPALQAELARIVEEQATPELLTSEPIPDEENVAKGLAGLFDPSEVQKTLEDSDAIWPPDRFAFNPTSLERAVRFARQYEPQRREARTALARPKCSLAIEYQAGFGADLGLVDVFRLCGRLEGVHAAESLAANDLAAAVESLEAMFRLAACLAAEKHPTVRLQGALARLEALAVLRAVVRHPAINRPAITAQQLSRLLEMLQGQLKSWPPDRDAWIGDRALGMHAYEMIRAGRLAEILTETETVQLIDEGLLPELPAAAQRNVNQDELYYLETMRKVIDACARPYCERTELFAGIRRELQDDRDSPQFPLVAARLLLPGIEQGQALQARDRAFCEAWAIGLAAACGRERPRYEASPLSGAKYVLSKRDGVVTVGGIAPDEDPKAPPVELPDLATADGGR